MEYNGYNIVLAKRNMTSALIKLSMSVLQAGNEAIYNEEFLCIKGLQAAIIKENVVVALHFGNICGLMRFYPNKRVERISLYQFAIAESDRGNNLATKMLDLIYSRYKKPIISKCPATSVFNEYYAKTGWAKTMEDDYCHWEWSVYQQK